MPETVSIRPFLPAEWPPGLALLWKHLPLDQRAERCRAELARLQTSPPLAAGFFGAWVGDKLTGAIACEALPGRVLQFQPPGCDAARLDEEKVSRVARELVIAAYRHGQTAAAVWAQCLAERRQARIIERLNLPNLERLATLSYKAAMPASFPSSEPRTRLRFRRFKGQSDDAVLEQLVGETYRGSRDCPKLEGTRTIAETLAGHGGVGESGTTEWWLAELPAVDSTQPGNSTALAGCLLLARHGVKQVGPATSCAMMEAVYWGITPQNRGRGFGAEVMQWGLWQSRLLGAESLVLAVDAENIPALRIYAAAGLSEWTRREVWGGPLGG